MFRISKERQESRVRIIRAEVHILEAIEAMPEQITDLEVNKALSAVLDRRLNAQIMEATPNPQ